MAVAPAVEPVLPQTAASGVSIEQKLTQLRTLLGGDDGEAARLSVQGGEPLDDGVLERWLRSKKGDVAMAADKLLEHLRWRASFVPTGRILQAEVQGRLDEKTVYMQGFDKEGRPVVHIVGQNIIMRFFSDNEAVKRFLVFVLDEAIACMQPEQRSSGKITVVFDCSGFGLRNADPHILPTMFSLLEAQYPERLGRAIIYNAPTIFWGLWQAAQAFCDEVTQKKIVFLDETAKQDMYRYIDSKVLPANLGGSAQLVPIERARVTFAPTQ